MSRSSIVANTVPFETICPSLTFTVLKMPESGILKSDFCMAANLPLQTNCLLNTDLCSDKVSTYIKDSSSSGMSISTSAFLLLHAIMHKDNDAINIRLLYPL